MKPFVVIVTLQVKPGFEAELLDVVMPIIDKMRHESSFINNVIHIAPNDPPRFMVYETWGDRDDVFNVQINRDYRKAYETGLPDMLRTPRELTFWTPLRSDFTFFHRSPVLANPIPILTSIDIKAGYENEYLDLIGPMLDAMRCEPGFINASLSQSAENPGKFLLYETWSDKHEFLDTMKRPYRKPLLDRLDDILKAPPATEFWTHLRDDWTFFPPAGSWPAS